MDKTVLAVVLDGQGPGYFTVRPLPMKNDFQKLDSAVQNHYEKYGSADSAYLGLGNDSKFAKDGLLVVRDLGRFYRAKLDHINKDDGDFASIVGVFLIDEGRFVNVPLDNCFVMADQFRQTETKYCFRCHLANAKPNGGKWSPEAVLAFKEKIFSTTRLELLMRSDQAADLESVPVDIKFREFTNDGPFSHDREIVTYMSQKLIKAGLAKYNWSEGDCDDDDDVGGACQELEDLNLDEVQPEPDSSPFSTASMLDGHSPVTSWLPPVIPPADIGFFQVNVTMIDDLGQIYGQRYRDKGISRQMRTYFSSLYAEDNSLTDVVKDSWDEGEACVTRYDNGSWYRGRILEKLPDSNYSVLFIDYGNVETKAATELRIAYHFAEMPSLIVRLIVANVLPMDNSDMEWDWNSLDTLYTSLHNHVVLASCTQDSVDSFPVPVKLKVVHKHKSGEKSTINIAKRMVAQKLCRWGEVDLERLRGKFSKNAFGFEGVCPCNSQ